MLFMAACLFLLSATSNALSDQQGVAGKIKGATEKFDKLNSTGAVLPVPENIVKVHGSYQGGSFFTQARKSEITRYQCSACHNGKRVSVSDGADISHADIKVTHGPEGKPLSCDTCHNKNNRDLLVTSGQKGIDFDHVYDMCGRCHFRQEKDWRGGAHGKRVTYWAGERVVKNCTSCHDPHSPRFKKRWPETYSVPHN